jgi:hypothetical protein
MPLRGGQPRQMPTGAKLFCDLDITDCRRVVRFERLAMSVEIDVTVMVRTGATVMVRTSMLFIAWIFAWRRA